MAIQPNDPAQFLAHIFQAGQEMMRQFNLPDTNSKTTPDNTVTGSAAPLVGASSHYVGMQKAYFDQMMGAWLNVLTSTGKALQLSEDKTQKDDKRFKSEAWREDPRFDLLKRTYLAYSTMLQQSVESSSLDEKAKGKMRFAVRQFVDAVSPANFFATNPEAVQLAMETGGRSLIEGAGLFFLDLAKGRISMTDERAFEVGVNLALTKGAVVFENELVQVIQYSPLTDQVHQRPLVIIPPSINKYYILDLQPENSLVRYAVEQGHTVFMLSWRNVTPELSYLTWDDYIESGVMDAINVALDITGADKANTLGFCIGGTLLASTLAIMAARHEDKVASMTLLTTMLDFSDAGEIGLLVSEESLAPQENAVGKGGVIQGKELALVFSSLRANDLVWPYVVNSYLKGKIPPAFDMLYWNSDGANLPGPMFCWYLRNAYLENNLRVPGKTVQCGVPVDFSKVTVPTFLYASREDHIVPWRTAFGSARLLSGEITFVLGASGHIAGVINPASKNKRNYWANGTLGGEAEKWLSTSQSIPGSWWTNWSGWLERHTGPKVAARIELGNAIHPSIEPAPGRYVKAKVD
ncbi:MAG: class I poly(R)-hydroxyalkanoic acid synthase [Pseudomonadota bacterium]